jgi:hypothetical protein
MNPTTTNAEPAQAAQHTPTPWKLNDVHHDGGRWITTDGKCSVRVIHGEFMVKKRREITEQERDANAALIVRAVNSHQALVGALENAANWIKSCDDDYDLNDTWLATQSALKLATS